MRYKLFGKSGLLVSEICLGAMTFGEEWGWGSSGEESRKIVDEVKKIAEAKGVAPSQVALNWVRQQPGLIIPIVGAGTEKQLKENLECLSFTLSAGQLAQLDEISRVDLGFPHDFLSSEGIRKAVFGKTYGQIDNHRK